MDTVST